MIIVKFTFSLSRSLYDLQFFLLSCQHCNDNHFTPAAPLLRVEDTWQLADANASSDTQFVDIEIGLGIESWWVVEDKSQYADTSDDRRFCAMFSDGAS